MLLEVLPEDLLIKELGRWLCHRHIITLRMVSRGAREMFKTLPHEHGRVWPNWFVSDRGSDASMPMITWLRDECPARWYNLWEWVRRGVEKAELDVLDTLLPALEHVLDTLALVGPRSHQGERAKHHLILASAIRATDPRIVDWLKQRHLLDSANFGQFLRACAASKMGFGVVARHAILNNTEWLPPTDATIKSIVASCVERDDADSLAFLDTPAGPWGVRPGGMKDWPERAAIGAAQGGGKAEKILTWFFGRTDDPAAQAQRLTPRLTLKQRECLQEALDAYLLQQQAQK